MHYFARRSLALCAKLCFRYYRQDYNKVDFYFVLVFCLDFHFTFSLVDDNSKYFCHFRHCFRRRWRKTLIVAHYLNFFCKDSYVRWCNSAQCSEHTVHVTQLSCHVMELIELKNCHRIVWTSVQLSLQCGEICDRSCIVRRSETLTIWRTDILLRPVTSQTHSKWSNKTTALPK